MLTVSVVFLYPQHQLYFYLPLIVRPFLPGYHTYSSVETDSASSVKRGTTPQRTSEDSPSIFSRVIDSLWNMFSDETRDSNRSKVEMQYNRNSLLNDYDDFITMGASFSPRNQNRVGYDRDGDSDEENISFSNDNDLDSSNIESVGKGDDSFGFFNPMRRLVSIRNLMFPRANMKDNMNSESNSRRDRFKKSKSLGHKSERLALHSNSISGISPLMRKSRSLGVKQSSSNDKAVHFMDTSNENDFIDTDNSLLNSENPLVVKYNTDVNSSAEPRNNSNHSLDPEEELRRPWQVRTKPADQLEITEPDLQCVLLRTPSKINRHIAPAREALEGWNGRSVLEKAKLIETTVLTGQTVPVPNDALAKRSGSGDGDLQDSRSNRAVYKVVNKDKASNSGRRIKKDINVQYNRSSSAVQTSTAKMTVLESHFAASSAIRDFNETMPVVVLPTQFTASRGTVVLSNPADRLKEPDDSNL